MTCLSDRPLALPRLHPPLPRLHSSHIGRLHSWETCGTVDGPGIRFVVFMQGCLLRCQYCHNPDTQNCFGGREVFLEDLMAEIQKYRTYMAYSGGGVTLSGGEPLLQPEFARALCDRCHELGIHVALDTSGFPDLEAAKPVLERVDLVLLDIKSFDPEIYHRVTCVSIEPTLKFARYLAEIGKPTWIRFVLVPGLTDAPHNVEGLARFVCGLSNVEKVEVLPFHKMGEYKWRELGYDYQLAETEPPTTEQVEQVRRIFRDYGLKAE